MTDWARATLKPGQIFAKADAVRWFAQHYPKIKHEEIRAAVPPLMHKAYENPRVQRKLGEWIETLGSGAAKIT